MPDSVAEAAVRAAVTVAAGLGVSSSEPVVLADGANVIVHLRPSPVVAKVAASTTAVRLETDAWLQRELNLVEFLAATGAPVMAPSPEMPATTYHGDGQVMSFWRYLRSAGGDVPPEATIGSMLRDLHATLRSYPGTLPVLAPLNDIAAFLARPRSQLSAGQAAALSAAYAGLTAELDQSLDQTHDQTSPAVQALHGDAGPGNLMNTDTGWVWHDFEDTCAGPAGWDLAASTASRRLDRSRILAAYGAPVDPGQLAICEQLRWLHLTVWYNLYAERLPDLRPRAAELLALWSVGDNPPGERTHP
jgi:phosphotransferase family enzyme